MLVHHGCAAPATSPDRRVTSTTTDAEDRLDRELATALTWYDFLCPFCYVGQQRNAVLVRHGLRVIELPFQAHPEIPPGGVPAGDRVGPMYAWLQREAEGAGLPLRWPKRLPDTRRALAAAEWARRQHPDVFPRLHAALFAAHFALGEDLGDPAVVDRHAAASSLDVAELHAALADGTAAAQLADARAMGRRHDVQGTPAWLLDGRLIVGLRSATEFERLAERAARAAR
jgi:predicted DsbA family dithiol-disulfide isomerase